jgi:hypothetical protein
MEIDASPPPAPFLGMPMREAVRRGLVTKRRAISALKRPLAKQETEGPPAKRPATDAARSTPSKRQAKVAGLLDYRGPFFRSFLRAIRRTWQNMY